MQFELPQQQESDLQELIQDSMQDKKDDNSKMQSVIVGFLRQFDPSSQNCEKCKDQQFCSCVNQQTNQDLKEEQTIDVEKKENENKSEKSIDKSEAESKNDNLEYNKMENLNQSNSQTQIIPTLNQTIEQTEEQQQKADIRELQIESEKQTQELDIQKFQNLLNESLNKYQDVFYNIKQIAKQQMKQVENRTEILHKKIQSLEKIDQLEQVLKQEYEKQIQLNEVVKEEKEKYTMGLEELKQKFIVLSNKQ